ncbi:MAG: NAD(P)/FAD-dependent oxidoreductase [Armatimonadetes bacterium]|nr:NAD(P)/FAD-dependent oxidoreductase [Armatimonadota bacterium]
MPGFQAAYDAVVIGSGPNGLAAAVRVAQAGRSVLVVEAAATPGGGCRSGELTLPGFTHDICSAVHPLGLGSPFFRTLPLERHGLEWIQPDAPLAHPFDDGTAAVLERSVTETGRTLGPDAKRYERLMAPLLPDWEELCAALRAPLRMARYPFGLARFGLKAIRSARGLSDGAFQGGRARALFAGCAAHSFLPPEQSPSAAFGLVLAIAGHAVGWPIPRGGSQRIADALVSYLKSLGGEVVCGHPIRSLDELPPARAVFCDLTPRQVVQIAGDRLPPGYRRQLEAYRYGPGAFKLDYALDGPIPWKAPECARAATVHLGGTRAEIAASERAVWRGTVSETPYVLAVQPSLFDPTRAPAGKHTVWAYCHVPNGYPGDMTGRIEAQIERFAPGFRDRILARSVLSPAGLERHNANYIGGDINGGVQDWAQMFFRPVPRPLPWTTPLPYLYLCSASTPPGGGVHGMGGYYAAEAALRRGL